jgi:mannose-6-phosphate isomerase-like protein (cupin superfamily)
MADKLEFTEPTGEGVAAGYRTFKRLKSPYERWMEEEGIPIFRGVGIRDTRELEMAPWKRLGGRGAYLYLDGLDAGKGMYAVEVPARGELNAEKHMFDKFMLVIEGRGTTEVWQEGQTKPHVFEWGPGTLFAIPINAWHRLVNAGAGPALLLAATNAPPIFNIFQSFHSIFENTHTFEERFRGDDDFFKPKTDVEMEGVRGRAAIKSNVFTDIVNCELPLDNQRAPGFRRIQPQFSGFIPTAHGGGFIGQYPSGRYSKAHFHGAGAVLVCLRGAGYSFNWPKALGPHPWEDGHGDQVKISEYIPGGLVAAAPGGGNWFHQHFSCAAEPLRIINYWGGPTGKWDFGGGGEEGEDDGEEIKSGNIFGIYEGGRTILYPDEDPFVRKYYAERLRQVGVDINMPEELYQKKG